MAELTNPQQAAWTQLCESWGATQGFTALPSTTAYRYAKDSGAVAWRTYLPADYLGRDRQLDIVLPGQFPLQEPQMWVDPNPFLEWPHAELNGKLCLWPPGQAPVWLGPAAFVQAAIDRFRRLFGFVHAGADQANREAEFAAEWMSYWRNRDRPNAQALGTVLLLAPPSAHPTILQTQLLAAPLYGAQGKKRQSQTLIIADHDEARLSAWADQSDLDKITSEPTAALLIPMHSAPASPGAPVSIDSIEIFLNNWAVQPKLAKDLFQRIHTDPSRADRWIIFSEGNAALAGLRLRPRYSVARARGHQNHKTRRHAQAQRQRLGFDIDVLDVQRSDTGWLHERDLSPQNHRLQNCRVAIVGAGSLGSMVAESLALAGIDRMTLIDPGTLETANIGRHALGAQSVDQTKVFALQARLLADYPHMTINAFDKSVQAQDKSLQESMAEADQVICTTADPASEAFLMAQLSAHNLHSLTLAWSEPHGLAGHSAHSTGHPHMLEDLFQEGRCKEAATQWPESPVVPLPGCGASHTPGAGNRIRLIASLVTEHVIDVLLGKHGLGEHRIWVASSDIIEFTGGTRLLPKRAGQAGVVVFPVPKASTSGDRSIAI